MSGTSALSVLNEFPADAPADNTDDAPDLQTQVELARNFGIGLFHEIERCSQLLDQLDPEPPLGEPLDERLIRVLNLPVPTSGQDAR